MGVEECYLKRPKSTEGKNTVKSDTVTEGNSLILTCYYV